jgi:hypothetical protein
LSHVRQKWKPDIRRTRKEIFRYAREGSLFQVNDSSLSETFSWSKAVLASNRHYLDGEFVPMPCPAEYNFFFTHDVLLADLGAVFFDCERIRTDLLFLKKLSRPDSVLPHAYYWKDGKYVTEFCGPDNWNHFWFIILTNRYLMHSADRKTVESVWPLVQKSLKMAVSQINQSNFLMYAIRPDWWDIGHIHGARAYMTILMIRALEEYVSLSFQIGKNDQLEQYLSISRKMRHGLESFLWDERRQYLMNMMKDMDPDSHFYAGSTIAVLFDVIEQDKKRLLLETAERKLLDPALGLRNVAPTDFHLLIDAYRFHDLEMGKPYVYLNGGVWPQNNVWFGLGWLYAGEVEKSESILKKYLTIEGIRNSPAGQPSFYEYRNANKVSSHYGEIDKPTFLWAGGLFIHFLYQLAGIRLTPFQLYIDPDIPENFKNCNFDLMIRGEKCRVEWKGEGSLLKEIRMDGKRNFSAQLSRAARHVVLTRGIPLYPYVSRVNVPVVEPVHYDKKNKMLELKVGGVSGQLINVEIVCPFDLKQLIVDHAQENWFRQISDFKGARVYRGEFVLQGDRGQFYFLF